MKKSNKINWSVVYSSLVSAILSGTLLFITKLMGPDGILVLDRFFPGYGGILQIVFIGSYSGVIAYLLQSKENSARVRLWIWNIFSIVFFFQLFAGIFVSSDFLMSGSLHVPVPALIIADPIYRGGSFFMPVLFLSTMIIVGPAWCSYLCYFGSFDGRAASVKSSARSISKKLKGMRYAVFLIVVVTALLMRIFNVPVKTAAAVSVAFGILGIIIMITGSGKSGLMVHCTSFCPIGILSNLLGKISPFRIKVDKNCLFCMKCSTSCRYGALTGESLKKGVAGFTCTLCGDCIGSCSKNSLYYYFPGLSAGKAKMLFIILISVLNAVFLGVARI